MAPKPDAAQTFWACFAQVPLQQKPPARRFKNAGGGPETSSNLLFVRVSPFPEDPDTSLRIKELGLENHNYDGFWDYKSSIMRYMDPLGIPFCVLGIGGAGVWSGAFLGLRAAADPRIRGQQFGRSIFESIPSCVEHALVGGGFRVSHRLNPQCLVGPVQWFWAIVLRTLGVQEEMNSWQLSC